MCMCMLHYAIRVLSQDLFIISWTPCANSINTCVVVAVRSACDALDLALRNFASIA